MSKEKRIFIVEDDEMMAQMLSDRLTENPYYTVHTFSTGEECIKNLGMKPDVIVLDFLLNVVNPDAADGLEILQRIKAMNKEIYVIMLSGQKHYGKAAQTIRDGALEYVVKDENAFRKIQDIVKSLK